MLDAIGEVDEKADEEPADHLQPGDSWKAEHLCKATEDAEKGDPGDKGDFEGAVVFSMSVAENPDAETDNRKNEQRHHGDELAEHFNREKSG